MLEETSHWKVPYFDSTMSVLAGSCCLNIWQPDMFDFPVMQEIVAVVYLRVQKLRR